MFQTLSNNPTQITQTQDFFMVMWANPYLSGLVIMISSVLVGGLAILSVIHFGNKE